MATIDIRRAHSLPLDEAKRRAELIARDMQGKLGIRWGWVGNLIEFDAPSGLAKGVTGTVYVSPREMRVEARLPFLLSIMKGTIEDKMNLILDVELAARAC